MNQVVKLLNTLGWLADISLVQLKLFFLSFHYSNAMLFSFVSLSGYACTSLDIILAMMDVWLNNV